MTTRAGRVLLGFTGSVATITCSEIVESILHVGFDVKCVVSHSGEHFVNYARAPIREVVPLFHDDDEWKWSKIGDSVLHIDLAKWADIFVIAPCSANTLAKLAYGICDNLLTSVARAWDADRPLVIAPAMNTHMWTHPHTARHMDLVQQIYRNATIVQPVAKRLACGDVGMGALARTEDIIGHLQRIVTEINRTRPEHIPPSPAAGTVLPPLVPHSRSPIPPGPQGSAQVLATPPDITKLAPSTPEASPASQEASARS